MPRPSWIQLLLSLFMSAERAGEIEGDLLEQRAGKPRGWLFVQVLQVQAAFALRTLQQHTATCLLSGYAVFELIFKFYYWVLIPSSRHLAYKLQLHPLLMDVYDRLLGVAVGFSLAYVLQRLLPRQAAVICIGTIALVLLRLGLTGEAGFRIALLYFIIPVFAGLLLAQWQLLQRGTGTAARAG